jgi:nitrate/nitrite-specific signal transduction histidine kinase
MASLNDIESLTQHISGLKAQLATLEQRITELTQRVRESADVLSTYRKALNDVYQLSTPESAELAAIAKDALES